MPEETAPPLPAQPGPPPPAARTEPLAIWSLVLSILSWFGCLFLTVIPAIILGHVSRSRIRKSNGALQGMNIALAGLIIAYAEIPFGVLGGVMLVDMIRSERVRLQEVAAEKKEIASDDGKLKITASGFWVKRTDLNNKASLQAAYNSKDMYVMVLSEPKSTVPNMTLEQHHQTTREHMLQTMSNSSATAPISITVDNHPALQDELSGTDRGKNIVFLHTTVEEGDSFHQIMAWTTKWHWQKQNGELREVTSSFHSEE
jgi:Domain of unknown function (DUF4190)